MTENETKTILFDFISIRNNTDNLAYLFFTNDFAFSVDSACPKAIAHALNCVFTKQNYTEDEILSLEPCVERKLKFVFTTHWHLDHSGGNEYLKNNFIDTVFIDFDYVHVRKIYDFQMSNINIKIIKTPCHTLDSLCFYVTKGRNNYLLTGDFIFKLGCGRFFEGNAKMFLDSVDELMRVVKPETLVLYGHDYYEVQKRFAEQYFPIKKCDDFYLTWSMECLNNPFLNYFRVKNNPLFKDLNDEQVIEKLRKLKDEFK